MKKHYIIAFLVVLSFLVASVGLFLAGQDFRDSSPPMSGKTDPLDDGTWQDVIEKISAREEVICTYGTLPDLENETERRAWIGILQTYTRVQKKEMKPYLSPDGPILSLGYDVQGYVKVMVEDNHTVGTNETRAWYQILREYGEKTGIKNIPVKVVAASDPAPEISIPVTVQRSPGTRETLSLNASCASMPDMRKTSTKT
ncbi:hypothetical protein J2129_002067 [Methanofollis sp. W23]|uniref:hypothetical protein n=1 Tax=Methanofollis sp. W23 TaxID=2817849 RepID=UPI001AE6093D|nr:hypothetical protein [Methanofollis sp. W23]MBP2146613.1 hypothetical protein [Methanofollis sp. W23]